MRLIPSGRHRLLAVGAALAVLTATPSAFAAARTSESPLPADAPPAHSGGAAATPRTVTLLTGDRVTVTPAAGGPATVDVVGPDGGRADARITTQDGDTYVYPASADPLVAAGRLDPQLFDVTRLVADGYDDARVSGLPLIVSYRDQAAFKAARVTGGARAAAAALPEGAGHVRPLTSINSAALVEDRDAAPGFWQALTGRQGTPSAAPSAAGRSAAADAPSLTDGIAKVWLDGKVEADLADSTAQIGAPEVWAGGNTGKGVDVAVLDTGYDQGHPDLSGVASSASFVPGEDVTDRHGHGTHVASTIAGSGAASDGKERGVAPGVNLHVGKVLDNAGSGQDSWIISGMEWAAQDVKARVVSMSLGTDGPSDGTDPLSQAVNALSEQTGTLFTIAAGNAGPGDHTVAAPGAATDALTVGAVDSTDTVADFSSRGPRLRDDAPKPEITAPGVDILAARSEYTTTGSGPYTTMSGTSMATPHVAGVAALVAAAHPDWTGSQIKDALVSTAKATPDNATDAGGNGRVDAVAATTATLTATGTLDAGIHTPGTASDDPVRTVQWHNTGTAPVTVDLAMDAPDAPQGLFTVADQHLVVPAGGTASTTVTTHLDKAPADNRYTGELTASAGGGALTRTLVSVSTQPEQHHLRVHVSDRSGAPVNVLVNYQRKGDEWASSLYSQNGVLDTIVPPGTYTVWTWVAVQGTHGASSAGLALLAAPTVTVAADRDTDVTLDGTKVRRTQVITPKVSTDSDVRVDFARTYGGDVPPAVEAHTVGDGFDSLWALPVAKPASGDLVYTARWRMQQPQLALDSGGQAFDDLYLQPGSAAPADGTRTLQAVYAGAGTPADYAGLDVKGKVAVVDYAAPDDDFSAAADTDQVAAAEQAGAALLVMVNDLDGRLREPISRTTLTVAGISHTEGEALIDRIRQSRTGSVPMKVVGHTHTGYLYDLVHTWHGSIPQSQVYAPTEHQLARVNVDFRGDPATEVDEFRYDIEPYLGVKVGGTRLSAAGEHRTDWVTADKGTVWMEEAEAGIQSYQYSGEVHYPAGRSTDVQWFGPFERPRINVSQPLPQRTGDDMEFYVPGFGDSGADHAGIIGWGTTTQETQLYRGDTLVADTPGYVLSSAVPAAKSAYRLVTTTERTEDDPAYPYSSRTSTTWGFTSATPSAGGTQLLPLVQLDYALPTDGSGRARRDARLTVTPSHIPGVSVAAVRTDKVELSYDDGATWQRATLSSSSSGATTALHAPAKARYVSVRVHASDARGNTVTQTVVRAAGLR